MVNKVRYSCNNLPNEKYKGGSNFGDEKGFGNGKIILWRVIAFYQDLVKDIQPNWISL